MVRRRSSARGAGVAVLAAVAAGALAASPAAADEYSGGMPSTSFTVRPLNINSTWVGYLDTARGYWNSSGAGASITRTTTSASTYTAGRWTYSWAGRYTPYGSGSSKHFTVEVNVQFIEGRAGSNLTKWILSTSTHELGHGLKLADNPSTSKASLMKYDRDPAVIYKPQPYDVSEVVKYK